MDAIADTLEAVESAVGLTLEALLEVTSVDEALPEANTAVLLQVPTSEFASTSYFL